MDVRCYFAVFLIFHLRLKTVVSQNIPLMQPFFFVCNYHGENDQSTLNTGQVAISISIEGNPEYYEPGKMYQVHITSSRDFDGFLLTGLYTAKTGMAQIPLHSLPAMGMGSYQPFGQNFMCSIVHSHFSPRPKHQLSFTWLAPTKDTGCVSFLATATKGQQILFKDTTVAQICEESVQESDATSRPPLADVHGDGVVFRDDFDSSKKLDSNLWVHVEGVKVSKECGEVLHGNSVVFCEKTGTRKLTTNILNTTTASVLQFSIGVGLCQPSAKAGLIIVQYSTGNCSEWVELEEISAPHLPDTSLHIVHLPSAARQESVCFQWQQESSQNNLISTNDGCWAMDNVLVINSASPPEGLYDLFDPIDTSNWLFFPGAEIKQACRSDQNSMVFDQKQQFHSYTTSRDLNLQFDVVPEDLILQEDFDNERLDGWAMRGGHLDKRCGALVDQTEPLVFDGSEKTRVLCTPFMDLSSAGNLRFTLKHGRSCEDGNSEATSLFVYSENDYGNTVMLNVLDIHTFEEGKQVSVDIVPESRHRSSRLCLAQKRHAGANKDIWLLDALRILPVLPITSNKYIQFSLNLQCGVSTSNNSVVLEYSTDHGESWSQLHTPCLGGASCPGSLSTVTTKFQSTEIDGWERLTLPLPYSALTRYTRFRWRQETESGQNNAWALDNVFIGDCERGCGGNGQCTPDGCRCDFGYEDTHCQRSVRLLPSMLVNGMGSNNDIAANFPVVKGASLDYTCGVLSSAKAVVFSGDGLRMIETQELSTLDARYIQFSIRVGSGTVVGSCPSPIREEQSVLLQFRCTDTALWTVLKRLAQHEFSQPRVLSINLPGEAKKEACKFRWWQPVHSGAHRDVWALDDVAVTSTMYNAMSINLTSSFDVEQTLDFHLGQIGLYCARDDVLSFSTSFEKGQVRYASTAPMKVGPSYILQFDLVMGCGSSFKHDIDNKIYLEYSTNHGMTWHLVRDNCFPPKMCDEYWSASIYDAPKYTEWQTITYVLPSTAWSTVTRFRWRQNEWSLSDNWAISNLYIGQQCPELCHGHGRCSQGQCLCTAGYYSESCIPLSALRFGITTDFTHLPDLESDWLAVYGGQVVAANEGCGMLLSGESLYFAGRGPRELVSVDLNTWLVDYIEFYIRVGGTNSLLCNGATARENSVLLQFSNNGGVSWTLLKELRSKEYDSARFVHVDIPYKARTESTRFRWWQPVHRGANSDQWALDQVHIGQYHGMQDLQDDFAVNDSPVSEGIWQTITEGMYAEYCQSDSNSLMFADQPNDKMAVTKDMLLSKGDIIQFRINVGCSKTFSFHQPVLLQYSHDSGMTWKLVENPCYIDALCHDHYTEGTVYYTGTYGEWKLVIIQLSEEIVKRKVHFRWWQKGGASSFAVDDVYIGSACPRMCHGRGVCLRGQCQCEGGFAGSVCEVSDEGEPQGMMDRFDDMNHPSGIWHSILGGRIGEGCGPIGDGKSLYFDSPGTREARTVVLNTTNISMLEFVARIGNINGVKGCSAPRNRNEGVIVDSSTDNGITWNVLQILEPDLLSRAPQAIAITLPEHSKSADTIFRWWQPLHSSGFSRVEWAIDNVVIGVNDSSTTGFQDNFDPINDDIWYLAMNAVPKVTCSSSSNALEFSKNMGEMRYAETWDFDITPSTFLQFDIAMGCSGTYSTLYSVKLEYSTDMGKFWHPVLEECLPPRSDCPGFHQSSSFLSENHANWTRVTLYLPPTSVSPKTRFRWLQESVSVRGNVWALDNIYLGEGCPWMCSGHGRCSQGTCICDAGYGGPHCVPLAQMPGTLRDDFDKALSRDKWKEVYGGEISNMCGTLVSGLAVTFYKENLRMAVTEDLDVSMATYIQFTYKYGCQNEKIDWHKDESIILQYSTNGGMWWSLLKEIYYPVDSEPRFYNVPLPTLAQTNSTRFRFWQPKHKGLMQSVWMLDDLMIGGSLVQSDILYETFDAEPHPESWLFWPGATSDSYCSLYTRSSTLHAGTSSVVFRQESGGERSITTADIIVNEMSVVQFDLNVGCDTYSTHHHPVRLEYSTDRGHTWQLVLPPCGQSDEDSCSSRSKDPTIYYASSGKYWQRTIVPLTGLQICGSVRFRWYQGNFAPQQFVTSWALDNVYIGMQCEGDCSGHGTCISGVLCECDDGFSGPSCATQTRRPTYLIEDFEGSILQHLDESTWSLVSGGSKSEKCGELLTGNGLYMSYPGPRMAVTVDLDLTSARILQFFLKLKCTTRSGEDGNGKLSNEVLLVQYSANGGVQWLPLEKFTFSANTEKVAQEITIVLPSGVRTNATRFRWIQPTTNGSYVNDWALDQVYIGGNVTGRTWLQYPAPVGFSSDTDWLQYPGSISEPVCASSINALHFSGIGNKRFAITADVAVTSATYLQYYVSMGCADTGTCYEVELEYSKDHGRTWSLLQDECLPSNVQCTSYTRKSVLTSDLYNKWHRVTVVLPDHTRSPATRFRWRQHPGFKHADTWAIMRVYIGNQCPLACTGHGWCNQGTCVCDSTWTGTDCSEPKSPLFTQLNDQFNSGATKGLWLRTAGGTSSTQCGVLAAGTALHFKAHCNRDLITTDLDLRQATFIQFYFRFGCSSTPRDHDENVLVEYSTNGGIEWTNMMQLHYDQYSKASYIMIEIPGEAKRNGARIRWWQPKHGGRAKSDWAIDNIVIGGKTTNDLIMKDNFDGIHSDLFWIQRDNTYIDTYCGSNTALRGEAVSKENVTLTTMDMQIDEGFMLQFSISVGCNTTWDVDISPVHLQYSTDYGMSWRYVMTCDAHNVQCGENQIPPSIYYANQGWQRVSVLLMGQIVSKATRFRWHQHDPNSEGRHHKCWALDDVFIGPSCANLCSGHGRCDYPHCICDPGFTGDHCQFEPRNEVEVKDEFNSAAMNRSIWSLVQGGSITEGCSDIVTGMSLFFNGPGIRQATTVDLDLRNARFIEFHIQIGGESLKRGCAQPRLPEDVVIIQYSVDAGINWVTIHTIDHTHDWKTAHRHYIPLPRGALTLGTRMRWWQPLPSVREGAVAWALDNVMIGGLTINPSEMLETFNHTKSTSFQFHPGGYVETGICGHGTENSSLHWDDTPGLKSATTQQLIVQENFMLQFKIVIGCEDSRHICNSHQPVRLMYNKEPSRDEWDLVFPQCLVYNHDHQVECEPHEYSSGSVYSAHEFHSWKRVTLLLPTKTFSSNTLFRWKQENSLTDSPPSWAIDDVFIGEACPHMCNGRGSCVKGKCVCDHLHVGEFCEPDKRRLLSHMTETFEGGISLSHWESVSGGSVGLGCGALLPHAHGKTLYFRDCGMRQVTTVELDTTKASKVMFVLQLGSHHQTPSCNIQLNTTASVLLQYTKNKGINWHLISIHEPKDYLRAKRVAYDLPKDAQAAGVQLRWWQPQHAGRDFDQWALDHVEIIMARQDRILRSFKHRNSFG